MKELLFDIDIKPGETGFTIRHGRYAYDLFDFGEKIQLWEFDENTIVEKIIGEAVISFLFIERYKNIDKDLIKHIKFPGTYEPEDLVTIIFYKRLKKGEALWAKSLVFFKRFFKLEPIIVNPLGRTTPGIKLTVKSKREQLESRVNEVLTDYCDPAKIKIEDDSSFSLDYGFDSLDSVEFVMHLQEEFNVEILDEEMNGIVYVKDVYDLIEKLLKERK